MNGWEELLRLIKRRYYGWHDGPAENERDLVHERVTVIGVAAPPRNRGPVQ